MASAGDVEQENGAVGGGGEAGELLDLVEGGSAGGRGKRCGVAVRDSGGGNKKVSLVSGWLWKQVRLVLTPSLPLPLLRLLHHCHRPVLITAQLPLLLPAFPSRSGGAHFRGDKRGK